MPPVRASEINGDPRYERGGTVAVLKRSCRRLNSTMSDGRGPKRGSTTRPMGLLLRSRRRPANGSFRMTCSNRQARNAMRCLTTVTLTLLVCLGTAATTAAQTAKDMIGTWRLVSDVNTASDGGKVEPFGHTPEGIAIFDSGGHFAIVISRSDLQKFASNNRMQGTPEENKAIVQGSIGFFVMYAVADDVIVQHIEGGTWPSWMGTDQKRTITSFAKDEQTWTTVASFGGKSELRWRRVK